MAFKKVHDRLMREWFTWFRNSGAKRFDRANVAQSGTGRESVDDASLPVWILSAPRFATGSDLGGRLPADPGWPLASLHERALLLPQQKW